MTNLRMFAESVFAGRRIMKTLSGEQNHRLLKVYTIGPNDNWEPLIAIAELCGYSGDLRNAALELSGTPDDTAPGVQLFAAVREIFQANDDKIGSGELAEELCKREEEPWAEWRRGKPITATGIAGLLKPFGIRPRNVWVGKSCLKGYRLEDFEDAFSPLYPLFRTARSARIQ